MELKILIPSLLGAEKSVLNQLEQVLVAVGCQEDERRDLQTAVAEACLNAIEHGNCLNPGLNVEISIRTSVHQITVEILDHGGGAELRNCIRSGGGSSPLASPRAPEPDSQAETSRGWGLYLVDHLVDHWDYCFLPDQKGFCMRLTKSFRKVGETG